MLAPPKNLMATDSLCFGNQNVEQTLSVRAGMATSRMERGTVSLPCRKPKMGKVRAAAQKPQRNKERLYWDSRVAPGASSPSTKTHAKLNRGLADYPSRIRGARHGASPLR